MQEMKEQFLADIAAEMILNDIPADLVINWDQTGLRIVPTGEWTIHFSGDKIVPVVGSGNFEDVASPVNNLLIATMYYYISSRRPIPFTPNKFQVVHHT